ncbi:MAG: DUF4271 domain-containing protein [Flavobacteriaceae bacterium]
MLREIPSNELFTIFIMVSIVAVATAKLIAPNRFNDFVYVVTNSKYLKIYAREQKFTDRFEVLLLINLMLSGAIFGLILYQYFFNTNTVPANQAMVLVAGIGGFVIAKIAVEYFIGNLFEINSLINLYLFQKTSYKMYIGLLLIPINAVLLYSNLPLSVSIWIALALILLINLVGFASTIKSHESLIKANLFYFILYLCALEIAPYVILYKVFIS